MLGSDRSMAVNLIQVQLSRESFGQAESGKEVLMKQAPLRLLTVQSGTREILKQWHRPLQIGDIRSEMSTRQGRRRLRAAKHQAKLRQQQRVKNGVVINNETYDD